MRLVRVPFGQRPELTQRELAAATRAASQLAVAGDIASRNTQVLSARTGEVESALSARCEALQARLSLLESELAAANRVSSDHAARRAAVEELAASQKAASHLPRTVDISDQMIALGDLG